MVTLFLKKSVMPKYVVERDIPDAGEMSAEKLKTISQSSCEILNRMGSQIHWIESYVTADKLYCIYIAANIELIREHARRGGFAVNSVTEVLFEITPATADLQLAN
jgi:hypothetical protein